MKTALIITGELREFAIAHRSWPFLNYPNVDVFVSTWETTEESVPALNIDFVHWVGHIDVIPYISDAQIHIHPLKDNLENSYKMFYMWEAGLKLIKDKQDVYDKVILIRPDCFLEQADNKTEFVRFMQNSWEEDVIYAITHGTNVRETVWCQDVMFCGTFNSMMKLKEISRRADFKGDIHAWLATKLLTKYKDIKNIPYIAGHTIVRSTAKNTTDHSITNLRKLNQEWFDAKNGY